MDARPPVIGDWSAYREIHPEQLRRAVSEPPVHAYRGSGGDGRPVRNVPVDADDLLRSLQRTAQETSVKVAYVPSATTGAVAFDEMRANAADAGKGKARHLGRESFLRALVYQEARRKCLRC